MKKTLSPLAFVSIFLATSAVLLMPLFAYALTDAVPGAACTLQDGSECASGVCTFPNQNDPLAGGGKCAAITEGDSIKTTVGTGVLHNPLNVDTLDGFLLAVLGFVKTIGGIFVVMMLVYTGFKFVYAQGNPEKLSEARTSLFWTVLGALVLLGATAIAAGIKATVENITV